MAWHIDQGGLSNSEKEYFLLIILSYLAGKVQRGEEGMNKMNLILTANKLDNISLVLLYEVSMFLSKDKSYRSLLIASILHGVYNFY